ncbi:hypothetical protein HK100_007738, partial [Physocladia obscura]
MKLFGGWLIRLGSRVSDTDLVFCEVVFGSKSNIIGLKEVTMRCLKEQVNFAVFSTDNLNYVSCLRESKCAASFAMAMSGVSFRMIIEAGRDIGFHDDAGFARLINQAESMPIIHLHAAILNPATTVATAAMIATTPSITLPSASGRIATGGFSVARSDDEDISDLVDLYTSDVPESFPDQTFDVMLSYQLSLFWNSSKAKVERVYDGLASLNLRVWLDRDRMHGLICERMAEAIEKSTVVTPFLNQGYQSSRNCCQELQYAWNRKKRIVPALDFRRGDETINGLASFLTTGLIYYVSTPVATTGKTGSDQLQKRGAYNLREDCDYGCLKKPVFAIRDIFQRDFGLKIWIEYGNINVNESFEVGIESSRTILVFYTSHYQESKKCLNELQYAVDKKKTIAYAFDFSGIKNEQNQQFAHTIATSALNFTSKVPQTQDFYDAVRHLYFLIFFPDNPADFTSIDKAFEETYFKNSCLWAVKLVNSWLDSPVEDENILWMNACPGFGKSMIAWCVSRALRESCILGSIFYFKENDERKNNATCLVATVAHDLAMILPEFGTYLDGLEKSGELTVIERRRLLLFEPITAFNIMIVQGLRNLKETPSKSIMVIIDGLDECGTMGDYKRKSLLDIIENGFPKLPGFIKIFVTACPQADIFHTLTKLKAACFFASTEENKADISTFISQKLMALAEDYGLSDGQQDFLNCTSILTAKANGSFNYVQLFLIYFEYRWAAINAKNYENAHPSVKNGFILSSHKNDDNNQQIICKNLLSILDEFLGREDDLILQTLTSEFESTGPSR